MTDSINRLRWLNRCFPRPADLWPGQPDRTLPGSTVPAGPAHDPAAADGSTTVDGFLTVPEVAAVLGISEKTVRRRLRAGLLRKAALGGRIVRVPAAELVRLADTAIPQDGANTINDVVQCYDSIPK